MSELIARSSDSSSSEPKPSSTNEADAAGVCLDDLGEPEGERESRHELLAARERGDGPGDAGPRVVHDEAQSRRARAAAALLGAFQGVAALAHRAQAL
jgi:hypothetical protein